MNNDRKNPKSSKLDTEGPCLIASFDSGKNLHKPKIALAKYMPNTMFS